MLSDESSSDSETGRFKCRAKTQDEHKKSSNENRDNSRFPGRSRAPDNDRYRREVERRRDERDRHERRSRDRQRFSRHSPVRHARRRHSREKSPIRRSRERERPRGEDLSERSKPKDHRSDSRERRRHSRSKHKSPETKGDLRDEVRNSKSDMTINVSSREIRTDKFERIARHKSSSSSPEFKGKRSAVHIPSPVEVQKKKTESPVVVEEHVESEVEVQAGSYYSMIPAVAKEKSEESSEIDSSDDEKLRAKLLNFEKESHKTRKKKQKKKHKRKSSKSSKDRDKEPATMEVSSTTDIDKSVEETQPQAAEVTSTQKTVQKESSEEGEISSDDDDSQAPIDIDPTDLRHKLKQSKLKSGADSPSPCGPALPPHLASNSQRSSSREIEGPVLPPHLQRQSGSIGPSIPDEMRKVLAERETHIVYESSEDEDEGIGPIPVGSQKQSEVHQRLEERALDMKIRRLDGHSLHKSETKSREQWMLELPEGKAKYLGLEARSFRAKEGPDMSDRSSWTDTPAEKAGKAAGERREEDADAALQREARARHIAARDDEQEHAVKKHKKKHRREESLLEIHQKKLKKKKKKEEKESKERRPFSRDVDLQVNRFDEAQKKSIIKKAQELNTRFGRGEAKYL